jgi:hypothetical protein
MLWIHNALDKDRMSSTCMCSSINCNHMSNLWVVITLPASSESSPSRDSRVRKTNRYMRQTYLTMR